jgi:hypothetical protein
MSAAPTLLDKHAFVQHSAREYRLTGIERAVLDCVVFRLLGLDGQKPFNGWTTNGVLATEAGTTPRTIQKVLAKFQRLGLLHRMSIPGRGGRVCLQVPGIVGAAETCKPRPLGDRTGDEPPYKTRPDGHGLRVQNTSGASAKTRPRGHLNPSIESKEPNLSPTEGAPGLAGEHPIKEPSAVVWTDEDRLTRPTRELLRRVQGLARKGGIDLGAEFFDSVEEYEPGILRKWLRLASDGGPRNEARLVHEWIEWIVSVHGVNPAEFGEAVAGKGEADRSSGATSTEDDGWPDEEAIRARCPDDDDEWPDEEALEREELERQRSKPKPAIVVAFKPQPAKVEVRPFADDPGERERQANAAFKRGDRVWNPDDDEDEEDLARRKQAVLKQLHELERARA